MSFPRYPAYKDSGVSWLGTVPSHWELRRVGYLFDERRHKVSDRDYPALSVTKNGVVPQLETAAKTDDGDNRKLVRRGDFVINSRSDRKGSSGLSTLDGSVSLINTVLIPRDELSGPFVGHCLRSVPFQEEFYRNGRGIVADLWSTNFTEMKDIVLPVPPLPEQLGIASFLDRETAKIDALVAEQERLIELLKEKRQAVISHAVTKGLNRDAPSKDSGMDLIGSIPQHWSVRRLKHVSPRLAGRLIVQPHQYFADEGVPILFGNNIGRGELHLEDLRYISYEADREFATCRVSAGDLLTVRVGDPGATIVVPPSLDGCHFASAMWIRQSTAFDSSWLCHLMNSDVVAAQIEAVNYGAAQEQFNIGAAANFLLPVPPLEEQQVLASQLSTIVGQFDALASEAQRAIQLLAERRSALISAAVTGQIDVREAVARSAA